MELSLATMLVFVLAAALAAAPAASISIGDPYTPVPAAQNTHKVFAHFMMGNSYSLDGSYFTQEIKIAQSMGIDGFACNVGSDDWQMDRLQKMYDAAASQGDFKIFVSLDMKVLANFSQSYLLPFVYTFTNHAAQYKVGGKQYVSTFEGESYLGRQSDPASGWLKFKNDLLARGSDIYFVPDFTGYGYTFMGWNAVDGGFSWNMWIKGTAEDSDYLRARNNPANGVTDMNILYGDKTGGVALYSGKTYMAGVSPWFFAHFKSKNWVYRDDDFYTARWENLIASNPDQIEIATWNDYGESHYIGSLDSNDNDYPHDELINSLTWTRKANMDHAALSGITQYYIQAYKQGSYPTPTQNQVFFWYRPHSSSAVASADPIGAPECRRLTDTDVTCPLPDNIYVFCLATSTFTISVTSGSKMSPFTCQPGRNHFTFTGFQEGTPFVTLPNNQQVQGQGPISNSIATYNYNFWIKSATF